MSKNESYIWIRPKADDGTRIIDVKPSWRDAIVSSVLSGNFWTILVVFGYPILMFIPIIFPQIINKYPSIKSYFELFTLPSSTLSVILYAIYGFVTIVALLLLITIKNKYNLTLFYLHYHFLFHKIRNEFCRVTDNNKIQKLEKLGAFSMPVCTEIANFFSWHIKREDIGCCIRLANHDKTGKDVYTTFGRSNKLFEHRNRSSVDIYGDEGLPKVLIDKIHEGKSSLLILKDINDPHIVENYLWKNYNQPIESTSEDICSQIVSPICSRENGNSVMVGILYITSRKSGKQSPFSLDHIEIVSAIADVLGCLYGQLLGEIHPESQDQLQLEMNRPDKNVTIKPNATRNSSKKTVKKSK